MKSPNHKLIMPVLFIILLFSSSMVAVVKSANSVEVEFLFYEWDCCPQLQQYTDDRMNLVVQAQGCFNATPMKFSFICIGVRGEPDMNGLELLQRYNLSMGQVPVIIVKNITAHVVERIFGEQLRPMTVDDLVVILNKYVTGNLNGANLPSLSVFVAFSLGLFSGVSPCLMAMLAFIFTYSTSASVRLKDGMAKATVFSLGLMTAYMAIGLLLLFSSVSLVPSYSDMAKWGGAAIFILAGLNLVGILRLPISTKPFIQRIAQRYGFTFLGLFFLGIVFSVVKAFCAAPFFLIVLAEILRSGEIVQSVLLLVFFSLGVIIPFLCIGFISGGLPQLAKRIRERYRTPIRVISGLILIGFGIWSLL